MPNKILQWNCRGIRANYEELLLLLNKSNPKIVCLQKTFLHKTKTHPSTYLEKFHTILLRHPDHQYIYLRMAPRIKIKQHVLLSSIKPFTRKPFQWKDPSSLQKYVPLILLSTSFLGTNITNLSYSLTICITITEK